MPIADSSLYLLCNEVADFIRSGLQTNINDITVYLGSPADVASRKDEDRINLFFYRFEPSSFQSNAHPNDPWRVRMYCMISCLAQEDNDVHPGEDDLRLLGQILSLFHENRILPAFVIGDQTVRLNLVFLPSSDEQLNQLWSIQGEASYRPSALFEVSLAPVMPETLRGEPPRVGSAGSQAFASFDRRYDTFSGNITAPKIGAASVNQSNPAWIPAICWVANDTCLASLDVDVEVTLPADFHPQLWIAGKMGETVSLSWEVWQGDNWNSEGGGDLVISSTELNPDAIPLVLPTLNLPALTVDGTHDRWQLLLTVTRDYQPYVDGPTTTLKSNPLLISLYRGSTL